MAKVEKQSLLKDGDFTVERVQELAFFDLIGEKAKTKGTSNKSYHIELHKPKSGGRSQIYTMWGPTGGAQRHEWRYYNSYADADSDYDKIIASKKKKGYEEIDVAQRAQGSSEAKQITKAVQLKNADHLNSDKAKVSTLHSETQRLIGSLMGATNQFVIQTLRCPLGQLTNSQIDKGRDVLKSARKILLAAGAGTSGNMSAKLSKMDSDRITDYTNEFYRLIPHNLGSGARGQMTELLLDDLDKIVGKEDDLDTLLDAKSVGAVLKADSAVDDQYKSLNADFTFIDHSDPVFKFMTDYFYKSAVRNHGYNFDGGRNSIKIANIWSVKRKDKEHDCFLNNVEKISAECGRHSFAREAGDLSKHADKWVPKLRPDLEDKLCKLYEKSNVWLCWHGTRSANVIGITKKGLLIRPSGAVHTGSMYGDGKYFAWQSTKSLNYTDGGYWTGGGSSRTRFMFLLDVAMGNMFKAPHAQFYRGPPRGHHSVYGKARQSGVYNDEMITYDFKPQDAQSRIRYLFEITEG
jgi:poly [ADP-ribose] polymerase